MPRKEQPPQTPEGLDHLPAFRVVNGAQLSVILGVSAPRISALYNAGMPRRADKTYDLAAAVQWSLQRALERGDVAGGGTERQLYYQAMGERAQLDVEERLKRLYGKGETDQFFMSLLVELREALLALPERVTRDRGIATELDREIADALVQTAARVAAFCGIEPDSTRSAVTAPTKKRRRVGARKTKAANR